MPLPHWGFATPFLFRQSSEILLTSLKGSNFLACCPLKIHRKPQRPDEESSDSCSDILADPGTFVGSEFLNLLVISLDLGCNCWAVHVTILRLNDRDRLRRSSGAGT